MGVLKPNSFIIVVGLPGSGKSFYCRKISKKLKIPILDDPKTLEDVINFFNQRPCGAICSPLFCSPSFRKKLRHKIAGFGIKLKWIFFEKNLKQCLINDSKRKNQAQWDIEFFNSIYRIPSQNKTLKVYS
jgi:hypothetical protein